MRKRWTFFDYNERGIRLYQRQAYDLAVGEFERAVDAAVFPLAVLYVNLGAAYLANKRYPEARASLEKGWPSTRTTRRVTGFSRRP